MKVSVYKNITETDNPFYATLDSIYLAIRDGKYREQVEHIRTFPEKKDRDPLKMFLVCICFSGIFTHRNIESMVEHTGLVAIDFDHLPDYNTFWDRIIRDEYTHMAFKSPSGDGVKVVVKIPANKETHRLSCRALQEYYNSDHLDSFEDEARVCYISYDPNIYWNKGSVEFTTLKEEKKEKPKTQTTVTEAVFDYDEIYKNLKVWMESRDRYEDGNKHKFIVKFAAACCRFGIPSHVAGMRLTNDYKLAASPVDSRDFESIVNRVYKTYGSTYCSAHFDREVIVDNTTGSAVEKEILDATLPVKDIITVDDIRDQMIDSFRYGRQKGETTYFPGIDEHWTWKRGEVTLVGGIMNHGKTAFVLQLCLVKSIKEGCRWAVFSPEQNPPVDFYDDLIQAYIGKPTQKHFSGRMNENEYLKGMEFVNEHFFYVFPKDDAPTPEYITERFVELIVKKNVDGCIIDPFNQLDVNWSASRRDDMYLSVFLSKEKAFALKYNVYKIIVAHPHSMNKKKDEFNYECPDVYDFNGGAMWGNKCDNVLQVYRPFYTTDKEDTSCHFISQKIKKQKLVGIPGTTEMIFDRFKGRYYVNGMNPIEEETQVRIDINETDCPF